MLNENEIFLNSSGCWCANKQQLDDLFDTKLDAIVTKTCTLYSKKGNPEPTYYTKDGVSINSKGLPNEGYEYYKQLYNNYSLNKKFILSVAWEQDTTNTLKLLKDYDSFVSKEELVELNLSCPNVSHVIPSYNPVLLKEILNCINNLELKNIIFSLKLSPYLDHQLSNIIINTIVSCNVTNKYKYIVLSNSIPNGLILNNGESVLSSVYGGLSGRLNKFISLSNIHYFYKVLIDRNEEKNIKLIGCGGIETVQDIKDYLDCGASYVQFGSCFYNSSVNSLDNDKINNVIMDYCREVVL